MYLKFKKYLKILKQANNLNFIFIIKYYHYYNA
jgi:hypothetical protein